MRARRWDHAYHYARDFGSLGSAVEAHAAAASSAPSPPRGGGAVTPPFDIFHWIASSVACSPAAADGTARAVDELPALPPSVLLGTATRAPISADDAVGGAADAGAGGGDYGGVSGEGVSSLIPSACVLPACAHRHGQRRRCSLCARESRR